jgi:glucosamine-phosphate N-acetyltransferase
MEIISLELNDYNLNFFELLNQLSVGEKPSFDDFKLYLNNLNQNHQIYIIKNNNKIIATGTLFIESKLSHNLGKVGHIEDIIVDQSYRNCGLGSKMIEFLIQQAKKMNCYKIILNCNYDKKSFYEKFKFKENGYQMVIYN